MRHCFGAHGMGGADTDGHAQCGSDDIDANTGATLLHSHVGSKTSAAVRTTLHCSLLPSRRMGCTQARCSGHQKALSAYATHAHPAS